MTTRTDARPTHEHTPPTPPPPAAAGMALTELLAALEGERRTHAAASRAGARKEPTMREPTTEQHLTEEELTARAAAREGERRERQAAVDAELAQAQARAPFVTAEQFERIAGSVPPAGVIGASFTIAPGHPEPPFRAVTRLDEELEALRRFGAPQMIDHLQALAYSSAVAAGWHDPKMIEGVMREPAAGERVALIHEEATELLQHARDGRPASHYIEDGKPEGAGAELADIVIRCLDYAGRYEIPLGDIIVAKMLYNRTREHRHGGRTL